MEEDDWSDSGGSCEETPGIDGVLDNEDLQEETVAAKQSIG